MIPLYKTEMCFTQTSVCSWVPDQQQWPRCVGCHSTPPPGAPLSPPREPALPRWTWRCPAYTVSVRHTVKKSSPKLLTEIPERALALKSRVILLFKFGIYENCNICDFKKLCLIWKGSWINTAKTRYSRYSYCTCSSCSALHWDSPITLLAAYTLIPGGGWGRPWPPADTVPSAEPPCEEEGAGRVGDSFSTNLDRVRKRKSL